MPFFGGAYSAPIKCTTRLHLVRSPKTVLKPPLNGKIQGLFKAYECFKYFSRQIWFSSTFQDSPVYSSTCTFQACANPVVCDLICLCFKVAYIANNKDQDQNAPRGAVSSGPIVSFNNMGLITGKPVFGGLPTKKVQTSLRSRAVWSAPLLLAVWKAPYLSLL